MVNLRIPTQRAAPPWGVLPFVFGATCEGLNWEAQRQWSGRGDWSKDFGSEVFGVDVSTVAPQRQGTAKKQGRVAAKRAATSCHQLRKNFSLSSPPVFLALGPLSEPFPEVSW